MGNAQRKQARANSRRGPITFLWEFVFTKHREVGLIEGGRAGGGANFVFRANSGK